MPENTILHVHCGDSSAGTLRKSGVPGHVIVWCDPVFEGPMPAGLSDDGRRRVRAEYLSTATGAALKVEGVMKTLAEQDAALARFGDCREVVLWFDACLFDQTILIRQLDWFSQQDLADTTLSLICIAHAGLGELDAEHMAALLGQRHAVTGAEFDVARRAWAAFCSDDPTGVERLTHEDTSPLPYLHDALVRHLEQFPSVRNGLNRLEHEALQAVADGHHKLGRIFAAVSAKEEQAFFGDTVLWACLDGMASGRAPLLAVDGPGRLPLWDPERIGRWTLALTDAGRDVLAAGAGNAGGADAVALNAIDRWLGGVHLCGDESPWRWNGDRLVAQ